MHSYIIGIETAKKCEVKLCTKAIGTLSKYKVVTSLYHEALIWILIVLILINFLAPD
jgi:hypothetical protein